VTLGVLGSNSFDERGLLGLAFHPNFQKNGRFVAQRAKEGKSISRPRILMRVDWPQFNHDGGDLGNPHRMSFDAVTGAPYVGDVGQNDIEEVNVVVSGANYGWNFNGGTLFFDRNGDADASLPRLLHRQPRVVRTITVAGSTSSGRGERPAAGPRVPHHARRAQLGRAGLFLATRRP
jgi:hypothetical protein